ncbi:MAG: type II toxin-antitoxin system VapC family toxin [Pseudanabaenaceae cyanobacterium bins.68]|nr:type II toxin-antitoxin system VapC family toxin [Pseudanabaenaceae cyanobacterium bins.68]
MPSVCIDASYLIGLLVKESFNHQELWANWQTENYQVAAPRLVLYEVTNVLHRLTIANQLSEQRCDSLLESVLSLDIAYYSETELHGQALAIARRFRLTATYDAHYLALAEYLDCNLWTGDRKLVNSVNLKWVKYLQSL